MLIEAEEAKHKVKDTAEAKEEEDSKAHQEGALAPRNWKSSSLPMELGEKLKQLLMILSRKPLYDTYKCPTSTDKT